jgi:hypothetical protein
MGIADPILPLIEVNSALKVIIDYLLMIRYYSVNDPCTPILINGPEGS